MKSYIVLLRHDETKEIKSTLCKDNDEVATLLTHLDTDIYSIEKIEVVSEFNSDLKYFCLKPKNLETGQKEE